MPEPKETAPSKLPELLPLGADAIVVRFGQVLDARLSAAVLGFHAAVAARELPGVVEIASALTSVLVRFDPAKTLRASLVAQLSTVAQGTDWLAADLPAPSRVWHVPVCFDQDHAPDLAEFAAQAGLTAKQIVTQATQSPLRVLAIGFAPGQPYLGYLPPECDIARRPALSQVQAGAVVAAVRQLVMFNNDSPTGWHQIAETGFRPFLRDRAEPFLLRAGDAVQLHSVSGAEYRGLSQASDGLGGARCEAQS